MFEFVKETQMVLTCLLDTESNGSLLLAIDATRLLIDLTQTAAVMMVENQRELNELESTSSISGVASVTTTAIEEQPLQRVIQPCLPLSTQLNLNSLHDDWLDQWMLSSATCQSKLCDDGSSSGDIMLDERWNKNNRETNLRSNIYHKPSSMENTMMTHQPLDSRFWNRHVLQSIASSLPDAPAMQRALMSSEWDDMMKTKTSVNPVTKQVTCEDQHVALNPPQRRIQILANALKAKTTVAAATRLTHAIPKKELSKDIREDRTLGFVTASTQLALDEAAGRVPAGTVRTLQQQQSEQRERRQRQAITTTNTKDSQPNQSSRNNRRESFPTCLLLPDGSIPLSLQSLSAKLVARITQQILKPSSDMTWDSVIGIEHAKKAVEEAIIWPLRRPDLFKGIRRPPRGLLLFGPPGTGKTLVARAIAAQTSGTFFNMSASTLMSKWVGQGEKLMMTLFAVAEHCEPSVIFMDEVDALLSSRETESGSSDGARRLKNEFLQRMDGVETDHAKRVLVIGATNRPQELDEAARRRFEQRLYIPLPNRNGRVELVRKLMESVAHTLTGEDVEFIADDTEGFSGSDMNQLMQDAAREPLRSLTHSQFERIGVDDLRPVTLQDIQTARSRRQPAVDSTEVSKYEDWNIRFGMKLRE